MAVRPKILGPENPSTAPKRPTRQSVLERAPWLPAPYELADVNAVQAVIAGTANPDQQRRAMRWVIEHAAATYDMAFRPGGEDGRRDTDFALGRAYVGQQIVKLSKLNPALLPRREPNADPIEPGRT